MDIKDFLAEQGLSGDEITAIVGNAASAKAMTAALAKFDEGNTALDAANNERAEVTKFWDEKVTPALSSVDTKVAQANSESARYKAYLTSLKDAGYEVPEGLLDSKTVVPPASTQPRNDDGRYVTADQFAKMGRETAPTLIQLTQMSNEYQDLYGKPYVSMEADFAEAQRLGKPFGQYARDKYKFADKRSERQQAEQDKLIESKVEERYKAKESELVSKYSDNPNTRAPLPSRFDRIEKAGDDRKGSWKSDAGRQAAQKDRMARFANAKFVN